MTIPTHRSMAKLLRGEAAGGVVLVIAAAAAIAWANSPWSTAYHELWSNHLTIGLGSRTVTQDLRHWINDGLMTLFFLVVGLEIKQEMTTGQLASRHGAIVPVAGAIGGMVVPALIFTAVNLGGPGASGWGIPMATDIAFAVGLLSLFSRRIPPELKVMLLGLAVVDDIGAIVVIAAFYSDGISLAWLAASAAGVALIVALRKVGVRFAPLTVVVAVGVWFATFESGVHATIAGVALGLVMPARASARDVNLEGPTAPPPTERVRALLHPWTTFLIVPLFALANAGVTVSADVLGDAASSRVTWGVVLGLVVGTLVGVTAAIGLVVRSGVGRLPTGVTMRHVAAMGGTAGIGFTVAIFVAGLAFEQPALADQAVLGVLVASGIASVLGAALVLNGTSRLDDG